MKLANRFPLYIPSKKRSDYMITSKALTEMGAPHIIVVEPPEVEAYQRSVRDMNLLATIVPLDMSYKARYELCDDLGLTRSTGPGPARNFIWDHSIAAGYEWHWVMDDNILAFYRLNKNTISPLKTPAFWRAMEDFACRYDNVAMAGPQYKMFALCRHFLPPFVTNTRIYSCNLIRNNVPYRWRGRYNEDTILSLDMMKDGWCTIQFNAFLQNKLTTKLVPGGNTEDLYGDGTAEKSKMLKHVHPDVTTLVWKFNRHHHSVDYLGFKKTPLRRAPDAPPISDEPNNYGITAKPVPRSAIKRKA